jgi:hypothetical protein
LQTLIINLRDKTSEMKEKLLHMVQILLRLLSNLEKILFLRQKIMDTLLLKTFLAMYLDWVVLQKITIEDNLELALLLDS